MSSGGAVAGLVAVIAAKKREEIFARFRERAALSEVSALALQELGLPGGAMLRMQIFKGAVVETASGKYYLNEDVVSRQQRMRRIVMLCLLSILVLALLAVWSFD